MSPYFGPRLAAQRRAIAALAAHLAPGDGAGDELGAMLDVAFPDPASVPARTRFASFVGVVHTARHPRHVAALKGYVNLRAADRDATVRLGRRWPGFRVLGDVVGDLADDGGPLTTEFAALEVGDCAAGTGDSPASRGGPRQALPAVPYPRTRGRGAARPPRRAARSPRSTAALADAGIRADGWRRPVFACVSTAAAGGGGGIDVSVHVPARALDLGADDMAGVARSLVERHGAADAFTALVAAMAAARRRRVRRDRRRRGPAAGGRHRQGERVCRTELTPAGATRTRGGSARGWVRSRAARARAGCRAVRRDRSRPRRTRRGSRPSRRCRARPARSGRS